MSHFLHSISSEILTNQVIPTILTHAHIGQPFVVSHTPVDAGTAHSSSLRAQETYNGGYTDAKDVRLRLGNGGAGQAGLIRAFADAFIKWRVTQCQDTPFLVEWYLGDTTQSLAYLAGGSIDIALTYNKAAEEAEVKSGKAVQRQLVFMDHFYLTGPTSNPAGLDTSKDNVLDMFNKIVGRGNVDAIIPPPPERPPTRFLSRFDKSATNIKESELFIKIGQVPWALAYSPWYHQYPRFPLQALAAASALSEYTVTDRGTWLSSPASVTSSLVIFAEGAPNSGSVTTCDGKVIVTDEGLLNPCNALLASQPLDQPLSEVFMRWLVDSTGGQEVVRTFKKGGEVLYTPAVPN